MKLEVIKNAVTSKAARQVLLAKKHSPVVMFGTGVVGIVGTTVLACRATLKVENLLEDADKKKLQIKTLVHDEYTEKDRNKDLRYHQIQTMVGVGKLYAPAVGLGIMSVSLLTGSHVVLSKRNVALTAAYKTLEEGFDKYRERIRDEYGEDKEREFYRGVQTMDVHDTKNGKVETKKYINPGGGPTSPYAVFFDEHNKNWTPKPEYNMLFLRAQQDYANDRLWAKGHVFLNEILRDLGFEDTRAGAVTGWVKNGKGDNRIDFGIFDNDQRFYDFIRGDEGIWLDFNVDGVIYDKI